MELSESALPFEVLQSLTRALPLVAWIVEVALRDDSERANRRERAALGAIDLVHTVADADQLAAVSTWQVEILREDITSLVGFPLA